MYDDEQHRQTRRIGQGMIVAAFVLAIVLFTWMFSGVERRANNPNGNPASTETRDGAVQLVLQRNRAGHYVMSGSINGVNVDFILDTGATDVVIPRAIAEQAGLQRGYATQAMSANGLVTVYGTRIKSLMLGKAIELNDVRASINPSMDDRLVLLGMSALRQIEFTQRGDQLTLRYHPDQL